MVKILIVKDDINLANVYISRSLWHKPSVSCQERSSDIEYLQGGAN